MPARTFTSSNAICLASVFPPECIELVPKGTPKEAVLTQLISALTAAGLVAASQVAPLVNALLERERAGTTALGKGLAMPHLRTEAVQRFVGSIGLAPGGVDFQSLDGAPTKLIFVVLGPHEPRERHFELMGRLSALLRDKSMLMFLQGQRTAHEVYDYLVDLDARAWNGPRTGPDIPGRRGVAAPENSVTTSR
jgi:PTS system nitrogen regulatory IIA component